MAKASNGLGKFSGKLGGAVFVIRNGKQIVREYNPRPSNPKSALQLQQRAKGNLAGRITKFVPKTAIAGLGVNAERRRSRFNHLLLKGANVTMIGDDYSAKIPWENLIFSEGSVVAPFRPQGIGAAASGNGIEIVFKGADESVVPSDIYESMTARVVVMVYDTKSQELVEVATRIIIKPMQSKQAATFVPLVHPAGYTAACFLIPMSSADGSALSIDAGMAMKDDAAIAALLSTNENAIVFDYGRSVFLGQTTFSPTTMSAYETKTKKGFNIFIIVLCQFRPRILHFGVSFCFHV